METEPDEVLSRAYLMGDRLHAAFRRCAPGAAILSPEQRARSLRATLEGRPGRGAGAWLFCYGSLLWNPTVRFDARVVATVEGWHRAFCLLSRAGRGTADRPGLLLGLKPGGSCAGVAVHIPEDAAAAELELLWRREMVTGAYIPAWLPARGADGGALGPVLAFTTDPTHEAHVDWPEEKVVATLATASGELGASADYLFRTRDGLRAKGIADALVERLAGAVTQVQATMG